MKKVMLVMLFALLAVAVASAQTFVPTNDVLGAHNNGGRGCAACHAPHSGGARQRRKHGRRQRRNQQGRQRRRLPPLGTGRIVDHPGNPAVRRRL